MAMVVDGSEWKFDGWSSQQISSAMEKILNRVHIALERNESVWVGEELQIQKVFGDFDLWGLMSSESPVIIDPEIWEELAAWLGRGCCYLDEEWPIDMHEAVTEIDGSNVAENSDVAWAHHNVRAGRAVACLSFNRKGVYSTSSRVGTANVHWVTDETSTLEFWRTAIDVEGDTYESLRRLAPHAFPSLYIHPDAWTGLHRLSGGYLEHRNEVKRHFAIFNDYGTWAFMCPPPALAPNEAMGLDPSQAPSNQIIERRFVGFNVDISPENPSVYRNANCRRAREITIEARELYCEWHAKIQAHQNRIHVHPPIKESNGKFIIAIVHEHLELP
ncbi:hypothetical protein [Pseudomonas chlororaphis]|uniref:hypothetical protein n=1 Tax=Pseudomonas chlororaphis TaxID=587753 RepID=UPI000F56F4DE|nr:hypothetical protein [Pseudomonas chlororaphis]AZE13289.1 hypothetical protein C4K10_5033 [Pseudomonas chlororaphis subsp. aureofaciens]